MVCRLDTALLFIGVYALGSGQVETPCPKAKETSHTTQASQLVGARPLGSLPPSTSKLLSKHSLENCKLEVAVAVKRQEEDDMTGSGGGISL